MDCASDRVKRFCHRPIHLRQGPYPGVVHGYIDDMAQEYGASDLVICRAGATTIAELTVTGKAAVLVPFPYATHHHQEHNARTLAAVGVAELIQIQP